MMMRRAFLTIAVAGCLAVGASAQNQQAQSQPPVFRSSTRLVVNTIVVRDKDGKVIEGLTATDFVVTEDGQPQEIAFVEFQRLESAPVSAATAAAAAPAAATAAAPAAVAEARPQPDVDSVFQNGIAPPNKSGDIKYRNRRLLILYF